MLWIHRSITFVYSAFLLCAISAGTWFLCADSGATPTQKAFLPPAGDTVSSLTTTTLANHPPRQDSITEASEALVLFLSARTAAQCSLFVREPEQHLHSLRSYVTERIPQKVIVSYCRSESRAGGQLSPVHWFELNLLEESRRLEVPIYPTDVGYKLDWRQFSRAYGSGYTSFAGTTADTPDSGASLAFK